MRFKISAAEGEKTTTLTLPHLAHVPHHLLGLGHVVNRIVRHHQVVLFRRHRAFVHARVEPLCVLDAACSRGPPCVPQRVLAGVEAVEGGGGEGCSGSENGLPAPAPHVRHEAAGVQLGANAVQGAQAVDQVVPQPHALQCKARERGR